MKTRWYALAAACALTLQPTAAYAQVPGIDLQLVPKIGFYAPVSDLAEAAAVGSDIREDREGSLAVGLGVELALPFSPVDVRVGFDYVTNSEITFDEGVGTTESQVEQQMLALTGDLVLRPIPRLLVLQPYLLVGAGVKRYDFEFQDAGGGVEAFDDSTTDFALHGGLGFDLGLGPLALVVEASDYISWFEPEGADDSEMQHDLFLMAGIRVGLF